ncbi:MAG TPA: hypothetical protein VH186_09320 [Chloroflexia bacterium]|nr:hypothetical protein [Chloroflexia bacterium]
MYRARELTRRYATLRPSEIVPSGQTCNRMPYFFATLRDLLKGNNHDREAAWNGEVRQENHARGEEQQLDASKSSLSAYPVVDINSCNKVPAQEEKRVNKGILTKDSNYSVYNRPSQIEKAHAKLNFESGKRNEHSQNSIYDSCW